MHAPLVGPNSGYGTNNRCLLDAIAQGAGRFKGIAVVPPDTSRAALAMLQAQGIVGIAFNAALHGTAYYQDIGPLLAHMEALALWALQEWRPAGGAAAADRACTHPPADRPLRAARIWRRV